VNVRVYTLETTVKHSIVVVWKMTAHVTTIRVNMGLKGHVDGPVLNKNAHLCAVHVYMNQVAQQIARSV